VDGRLLLPGSTAAVIPFGDLERGVRCHRRAAPLDSVRARYLFEYSRLLSYGADTAQQWQAAAGYVDRILRGDNPRDLPMPVQKGCPPHSFRLQLWLYRWSQ